MQTKYNYRGKTLMKKMLAVLLSISMLLALCACGGNSTQPTAAPTSAAPETEASSSVQKVENVEIRFSWWGSEVRNNATLEAIAAYEAQNPGVKIIPEYTGYEGYQEKLYAQIAAGTAPDIFTSVTEWYSYLGDVGAMADMTGAFDMSGHSDAYIEACSYDGKVCGVSTSLNGYGIYVNTTLAKELDITIPDVNDDYSWDDLAAIWAEVAEKSNGEICGVMDPRYAGWAMEAFGYTYLSRPEPYMYSNDGLTIRAEDVTAFIDYFNNLPEGAVLPVDESFSADIQTSAPVANRRCLMAMDSTGTFAIVQSQTEDELTLIPYPHGPNGESANCARPGLIQNVYSGSQNKEAAFKFLDWFTNSEEAAIILGTCRGVLPTEVQREALMASGNVSRNDMVVINVIDAINKDTNMHTFLSGPIGIDEARMDIFEDVVTECLYGYIDSTEAGLKYMEMAQQALDSYK